VNAFSPSNPEKINRSWYQQSPDSLVAVASSTEGVTVVFNFSRGAKSLKTANLVRGLTEPPLLVRQQLRKRDLPHVKAAADTLVREDPRVVLQAPLEDGATWTAFDFHAGNGDRFRNRRTVLGDTTITTPAGQYDAVEVQTTGSFGDNTFRWSDFYSEAGLVKHVYTDTLEQTDEFNDTITEEVIVREVHTLTDHEE
jgi:hypothetical protein